MGVKALTWAKEVMTPSSTCKLVLIMLADCHNDHDGRCFPSVPRLARESQLGERTVRRSLRLLEDEGLISTVGVSGKSNQYELHMNPGHHDRGQNDHPGHSGRPTPATESGVPRPQWPPNHNRNQKNEPEVYLEVFDQLWIASGRRGDKQRSLAQWKKRIKAGTDPNLLLSRMKDYAKVRPFQYRKYTEVWLRDKYDEHVYEGEEKAASWQPTFDEEGNMIA